MRALLPFPEPPAVPDDQCASGPVPLRYEDVAQDGRITLLGLPNALGAVLWRNVLAEHPLSGALRASGVVPLLTRVVVVGGGGPVSVRRPLQGEGCFQLAHAGTPPAKLFLNMWADVQGVRGRTYGPPPEGAGEPVALGRVFAEHVFTRPFAATPAERKVERLEVPGQPPVPPARWEWHPPDESGALPPGAAPLEDAPSPDPAPVVFGLDHTDSNQHVNSLVYPRLFVDAALRRLAALGRDPGALLARAAEVAWRKPCFAGQRMRIVLRAFALGDAAGAAGAFVPADDPAARPHCFARVAFAA